MGKKFDYDVIVIGSGPAGASSALYATNNGLKTALIESNKWGGSFLNYSDVPASALFEFSHLYHKSVRGAVFGLSSSSLRYNYPTAQNWKSSVARRAGANSKKRFESAKIACFSGFASFLSPHEIAVKDSIISASKFIIATGSKLSYGDISGIESATCLTPAEALALPRPPKSVFIVGGGSTGVELANYFAELGTQVVIAELADRILPHEEEETSRLITQYFENSLQIKVLAQSRVVAFEPSSKPGFQRVIFRRGIQEKAIEVSTIILATGSKPATNISLENAGVEYSPEGIEVDNYLRTSTKHIYAAGDCLGRESSTERASYEGALAIANAIGKSKTTRNYEGFIRVTNTFPSIASVGLSEEKCLKSKLKFQKTVLPLTAVPAASTSNFRYGFIKMLVDPKGRILGGTVVCPKAELVLQEIATAIKNGVTVDQLATTPHISSSWSDLVRLAAHKLAK